MDEKEILEELAGLAPRKVPSHLEERILRAGRARARKIRKRRSIRGVLAAAACLALFFMAQWWGEGWRDSGEPAVLAVATKSLLVETEARKALLEARIARLERLASSVPGKSRHLKVLEVLRKELDRLVIPSPVKKKEGGEKKEFKNSWVPGKNGGWKHA